jgi:hypothetical protein
MAYSGQRELAYNAGFDDGLFDRPKDNPYNNDAVPGSFTAYEDGFTEGALSTNPPRGATGDKGDTGATGTAGTSGLAGIDGSDMLTGAGDPASGLGTVGDVYVDADSGNIWLKTGASTWTFQGSGTEVALATQVDFAVAGPPEIIYKGEASPGTTTASAAWRIQRITIQTDDDASFEWADGNATMDNIWNNRAALSYS